MSLLYPNRYPGRWDPTSAAYPQGKFRNRSSPTAKDGSFCEMDWANDWAGFFGAILNNAGVVPNGSIDTAQSSQLFTALQTVILKSLPKRSFAANDFIRIPDVPGGLIVQWGRIGYTSNPTNPAVTFPVRFTNKCTAIVGFEIGTQVSAGFSVINAITPGPSVSGVSLTSRKADGTLSAQADIMWIAIGD